MAYQRRNTIAIYPFMLLTPVPDLIVNDRPGGRRDTWNWPTNQNNELKGIAEPIYIASFLPLASQSERAFFVLASGYRSCPLSSNHL